MLTPRVLKLSLLRSLRAAAELAPPSRSRYASLFSLAVIGHVVFLCGCACARQVFELMLQRVAPPRPRWRPRLLEIFVWV